MKKETRKLEAACMEHVTLNCEAVSPLYTLSSPLQCSTWNLEYHFTTFQTALLCRSCVYFSGCFLHDINRCLHAVTDCLWTDYDFLVKFKKYFVWWMSCNCTDFDFSNTSLCLCVNQPRFRECCWRDSPTSKIQNCPHTLVQALSYSGFRAGDTSSGNKMNAV